MAFRQTRAGNLDELAVLAQVVDVLRTAVAHAGADAANHLEDGVRQNSLIRHAPFNTFGDELLRVLLEVAVFRAVLHRAQRTHAAVHLVGTALIDFGRAGSRA